MNLKSIHCANRRKRKALKFISPDVVRQRAAGTSCGRNVVVRFALAAVAATMLHCAQAQEAPQSVRSDPTVVRLGILSTIGELSSSRTFANTIRALETAWNRRVEVSYYDLDTLPAAVHDKKLDFFIANAGSFTHLQMQGEARHLATRKIGQADDPNFSMGGIFFVRSDNTSIRTFEDMRGKSALSVARNAFGGFHVPLGEIHARGYDPDRFFGSVSFSGYPMQNVIFEMRHGRAEVGMVRACLLEDMIESGLVGKNEFRVIAPKNNPHLRCQTSTDLYPDWVFGATTEAKAELSRRAGAALFTMPEDNGMSWSVASDFTRIDALFKNLKIGHYSYLREWTFTRVWQEYPWAVIAAFGLLILILWHSIVITFEVRRKTASLRAAMQEREIAQTEVLQAQNRLQTLERASLVGMLSNMVAHELKQPLGAIANFADGIRTFAGRSDNANSESARESLEMIGIAADEIIGQTQRASDIIERVRGYAKQGPGQQKKRLQIQKVVDDAVRDFRLLAKMPPPISLSVTPAAYVEADSIELSLVILNLLKNATEAIKNTAQPQIDVRLEAAGSMWKLTIADNGPTADISGFTDLFSPKVSTKASGLGLGLAISARIMEAGGGRLTIERNEPFGLKAVMWLPKA